MPWWKVTYENGHGIRRGITTERSTTVVYAYSSDGAWTTVQNTLYGAWKVVSVEETEEPEDG